LRGHSHSKPFRDIISAMHLVIFDTPEAQAEGLQHLLSIDPDALYVFPMVFQGAPFHSRNVAEPFDIAFLSKDFEVIRIVLVIPEEGTAVAPRGTSMAVEARAGVMETLGWRPGVRV
jgi:uncharacterized membrane protein (UPF0127 family)